MSWQNSWGAQSQPSVQLKPLDWKNQHREQFRRKFIETAKESVDANECREALQICIEDAGDFSVLPNPIDTFEELGVIPDYALEGLKEHGIVSPMPVQAQALPLVLAGADLIGLAQTGSGKTLAFLLPAVVHIEAQEPIEKKATPIALILAPTRELAVQISDEATKVLKHSRRGSKHYGGIWTACVYGGGKKDAQLSNLAGSQILVATPGRLMDFLTQGQVSLERVTYFVLDEADRMLEEGFQSEVDAFSSQVRPERQVLFFSATWSAAVQKLASKLCFGGSRPVRISVGQGHSAANGEVCARHARDGIIQEVVVIDYPDNYEKQSAEKRRLLDEHLHDVLSADEENKVLVFVSQKTLADELAWKLDEAGFKAASMHGGKSQDSRLWTLDQFRKGDLRLLVATDVIGRGIDIPSVSHVVVYDMGSIDDYVHRIGRTARGKNAKGHALAFFEYWPKGPGIAAELVELLAAAKQPVPEDLKRIAREVAMGKRPVFSQNSRGWKADDASKSRGSHDWKASTTEIGQEQPASSSPGNQGTEATDWKSRPWETANSRDDKQQRSWNVQDSWDWQASETPAAAKQANSRSLARSNNDQEALDSWDAAD